ncbi:MAG: M23 family metallopeptidase [Treponemataceae bacterium]
MQIISYLNYGTDNKKKKEKKKFTKSQELVIGQDFTLNLALSNGTKSKESPIIIKASKIIFLSFVLVFTLSMLAFFILFYFTAKVKTNSFELYALNDSQTALQEFLFPHTEENITSPEMLSSLNNFLSEVSFKTYTVRAGDTISGVAYKFGLKSIGTLIALNNISNVKRLRAGETLKIPSMDGISHTVKQGETLGGIASKYGLSLNNLVDANDLKSETICTGDTIFIPGGNLSSFQLKKALGELFIYPVRGRLTSPFGYRRDPFTGLKTFHNGIDIANRAGTTIKCVMDGKVSEVGYNSVYGNYIIIIHDGGYQSLYGHLLSINVKRGIYITQGTKIGRLGSSGRSTGPHLHFSIYKNGKAINPLSVLDN